MPAIYKTCSKIRHLVVSGAEGQETGRDRVTIEHATRSTSYALLSTLKTAICSGCRLQTVTGTRLDVRMFRGAEDSEAVMKAFTSLTSTLLHTAEEDNDAPTTPSSHIRRLNPSAI